MLRFNGLKINAFEELIKASTILFIASGFSNLCNLLFWLFMVRFLSPVEYGILNVLFSVLMIISLPSSTINTIITKFAASHYGKNEFSQIKNFIFHFGKRVILTGILFLLTFVLLSHSIGVYLKIPSTALIITTGIILSISIISPLTFGILQGAQRFLSMAVNAVLSSIIKLCLGIILVLAGFKVMGALVGFGLAVVFGFVFSFFQLPREIVTAETLTEKPRLFSAYEYSLPVFLSLLGWMVLTNGDVILVKHFFSPQEAGFYSVAQTVGKIILFLPGIISVILFPKMNEAFSRQEKVFPLLKKGLLITGFLCTTASIFCMLYPDFVLKVLTRKDDLEAVRLVLPFCIAMTFYAMVNLFVFFYLAIQRLRFTVYLLIAGFLQSSLIAVFHPNLPAIVFCLILISALLFLAGLLEAIRIKHI